MPDPVQEQHVAPLAGEARAVDDARLAPHDRRQQLGPVLGVVLEVGVLHQDEVAGHVGETGADGRALAPVGLVHDDAHGAVGELAEHVAGAVGAAVVDDDDLEVDRAARPGACGARSRRRCCARRRRGRSPTACGTPASLQVVTPCLRYQSWVRARPSRRSTRGCQSSTASASEMSGRRWRGSSAGKRREHDLAHRPRDLEHDLGQLEHGELGRGCRCSSVRRGPRSATRTGPRPRRRRSRTNGSAPRCRRP